MYQPRSEDLHLPDAAGAEILRKDLESSGFVVLEGFAAPELLDALRVEAAELCRKATVGLDGTMVAFDSENRLLSLHYLDRHSDLLFDLMRIPELQQLADRLLGSRSVSFLSEYFTKPAPDSDATPPHQDQVFYRKHFDDELAIAVWIALTDVDEDSGVLQYATQQPPIGRLLPHRESEVVNFGGELVDDSTFSYVSACVRAGDAIVHHSYAVHRSGPMRSETPRAAVALNFRRSPYRESLDPVVA